MGLHRFYLKEGDSVDDRVFTIESEELIHQWRNVLRFRTGESVVLFDGTGREYVGEITGMNPKTIEGKVISMKMCDTELPNHIILAQSILKNPEKFEWILQKGTELGVAEFYPVITHRTEALSLRKIDRLQRILVEATEQCGRCIVPILHEPVTFEKFLRLEFFDKKEVELIVPHLVADGSLADFSLNSRKCVVICIGPEGGFDENEIVAAREVGARIVTLGRRVLRSETAALSAVAQLAAKLDG